MVGLERGDSAGVPWSGRTLTAQPFAGDDGSTDPALQQALAQWHHRPARGKGVEGEATVMAAVVRAWAPTRVLVPIVAVLGDGADVQAAAEAGQGDKSADMALVTITTRAGVTALPVFSGTAGLRVWRPDARPVPVEAARAAQAAVVEQCDTIVIDVGSEQSCELPRPVVWAVAQGRDWVPPATDPQVLAGVANLMTAVPLVVAHRCEPDGVAGLIVVLGLHPGLTTAQVSELTARVTRLLASDPVVTERVSDLKLQLRLV